MERKILWMLCIGVGYWMSAQDAVANHPIDGNPHWAVYARMTHLADSTSTKQEDGFFDDVPIPKFPGGTQALVKFIYDNLRYPKELLSDSIEGRSIIQILVDEQGNIASTKILRSSHPLLDAEALRIVRIMPCWEPARDLRHGEPIKGYFTFPIQFKLPKK
ncbi:MAG: energy transducer TonB [Bacteroidaceae bacterium]|nr:energy transducer TonB [Bacteroidaceae bacterium]